MYFHVSVRNALDRALLAAHYCTVQICLHGFFWHSSNAELAWHKHEIWIGLIRVLPWDLSNDDWKKQVIPFRRKLPYVLLNEVQEHEADTVVWTDSPGTGPQGFPKIPLCPFLMTSFSYLRHPSTFVMKMRGVNFLIVSWVSSRWILEVRIPQTSLLSQDPSLCSSRQRE